MFRAASCTGALYQVELYVVCGDLPDLPAGIYHFSPKDFALYRLREGDYRAVVAQASGEEPNVLAAPRAHPFDGNLLAQRLEIPGPDLSSFRLGQWHDRRSLAVYGLGPCSCRPNWSWVLWTGN